MISSGKSIDEHEPVYENCNIIVASDTTGAAIERGPDKALQDTHVNGRSDAERPTAIPQ
jgi:hypothetical protein